MVRPSVLGLLLACAASLSGAAVILESAIPLMWAKTFEQIVDFQEQGGTVSPNPWLYLQRMSLYRLMIAATDPYMGSMGSNATDSPMWGLPLQLLWMLNSGRLTDPTGETTCETQSEDSMCISPKSWWSCQNYFTSALPFLSAAQQGMFGDGIQVEMQKPAGYDEYCTTYSGCSAKFSEVMTNWDAFFQGLKASTDSVQPDSEKKDYLLGLFWNAQMASTYASANLCKSKQDTSSTEEIDFANSWMNSAEYVSAAHFQSNFQNAAMFIAPLPSRILKTGDVAPDITDLTTEENHTLSTFAWMRTINSFLGGTLVNMWKRAMCSVSTREKGQNLLHQLMLDPSFATGTFVSILTDITTSC